MQLTIKVSRPSYRDNPERLAKLERYAMARYSAAWAARHIHVAEVFFAAADRSARLCRVLARSQRA